jgi:GMP synthase PP-ATPase subunit
LNDSLAKLFDEASDWVIANLPSLSNRNELLKIFQLYVEKRMAEEKNTLLVEEGLYWKENRKKMEDLFSQQSELVKNQTALIDELSKANKNKRKTIDALQLAMVTPSKN